jgi:hypothetical protein
MMNMQRRKLRKRKEDARINIINILIKRTMKKQIKLGMDLKMMGLIM